ncbi:hypothetical protein [Changchengzhania lutea]|uniref:hypothetical protein n=1 Tax=Changchengzhania lutea TaxID=2049305 RepID=UPI00115F12F2|nr:hypothetical protein [Changchengzhania lutea]
MLYSSIIFSTLLSLSSPTLSNNTSSCLDNDCKEPTNEEVQLRASLFETNPQTEPTDLDWDTIELYELEEAVIINFDTKKYLPVNFNPLKGKHDLDWSKIELVELEEPVTINFNTQCYLPENFDSHQSL